ncbi:hypothetical protein FNF28_00923 [Cafeteria roenbergensis]|uniref:CFA20 domain-containing protein n=2 Tax=Cafeteria roenbergensis TaxID=33653 RepID=A0A5A8E076_CAFRO|nr:hypothetical protein FNF28_00923 [Cafeteria roenbergensis]
MSASDKFTNVLKEWRVLKHDSRAQRSGTKNDVDAMISRPICRLLGKASFVRIPGAKAKRQASGAAHAALASRFLYVQMRKVKEHAANFHLDLLLDDHSVVRLAFSTRYASFRVRQGRLVEVPLHLSLQWTVLGVDLVQLVRGCSSRAPVAVVAAEFSGGMALRGMALADRCWTAATMPKELEFPVSRRAASWADHFAFVWMPDVPRGAPSDPCPDLVPTRELVTALEQEGPGFLATLRDLTYPCAVPRTGSSAGRGSRQVTASVRRSAPLMPLVARQSADADVRRVRFSPFAADAFLSCGFESLRVGRVRRGHTPTKAACLGRFGRGVTILDAVWASSAGVVPPSGAELRRRKSAARSALATAAVAPQAAPELCLVAGSSAGAILVVGARSLTVLVALGAHTAAVTSVSVTKGYVCTSSLDGFIKVWPRTLTEGSSALVEARYGASVAGAAPSGDGLSIAAATREGSVGMLDLRGRSHVTLRRAHTAAVTSLSVRGSRPVLADDDWQRLLSGDATPASIRPVHWDCSESAIATASADGTVRVWDPVTLAPIMEVAASRDDGEAEVGGKAASADEAICVAWRPPTAVPASVWDRLLGAAPGAEPGEGESTPDHGPRNGSRGEDGNDGDGDGDGDVAWRVALEGDVELAAGFQSGTVRVYHAGSNALVAEHRPHLAPVLALAFAGTASRPGGRPAGALLFSAAADGVVWALDACRLYAPLRRIAEAFTVPRQLTPHVAIAASATTARVAISWSDPADGRGGSADRVLVVDAVTLATETVLGLPADVEAPLTGAFSAAATAVKREAASADPAELAAIVRRGTGGDGPWRPARQWDAELPKPTGADGRPRQSPAEAAAAEALRRQRVAAGASASAPMAGAIALASRSDSRAGAPSGIASLVVAPAAGASSGRDERVIGVSLGGALVAWSLGASEGHADVIQGTHRDGTGTVAASWDGRLVATGGADGCIRVWDGVLAASASSHPVMAPLRGPHGAAVTAVAFIDGPAASVASGSASVAGLVSGSADGSLALWHLERGDSTQATGGLAGAWVLPVASSGGELQGPAAALGVPAGYAPSDGPLGDAGYGVADEDCSVDDGDGADEEEDGDDCGSGGLEEDSTFDRWARGTDVGAQRSSNVRADVPLLDLPPLPERSL